MSRSVPKMCNQGDIMKECRICIRVEEKVVVKLHKLAKRLGVSLSDTVRQLLRSAK
jgi:macrodomain Ter protein organizer (MatP/YcbG family)